MKSILYLVLYYSTLAWHFTKHPVMDIFSIPSIQATLPYIYLPFDLRQESRVCLFAALHALPPHSPDLLPQLGGVLGCAHVDKEVPEHRDLQVDVHDYLELGRANGVIAMADFSYIGSLTI